VAVVQNSCDTISLAVYGLIRLTMTTDGRKVV